MKPIKLSKELRAAADGHFGRADAYRETIKGLSFAAKEENDTAWAIINKEHPELEKISGRFEYNKKTGTLTQTHKETKVV